VLADLLLRGPCILIGLCLERFIRLSVLGDWSGLVLLDYRFEVFGFNGIGVAEADARLLSKLYVTISCLHLGRLISLCCSCSLAR
jgi:urea transporter